MLVEFVMIADTDTRWISSGFAKIYKQDMINTRFNMEETTPLGFAIFNDYTHLNGYQYAMLKIAVKYSNSDNMMLYRSVQNFYKAYKEEYPYSPLRIVSVHGPLTNQILSALSEEPFIHFTLFEIPPSWPTLNKYIRVTPLGLSRHRAFFPLKTHKDDHGNYVHRPIYEDNKIVAEIDYDEVANQIVSQLSEYYRS